MAQITLTLDLENDQIIPLLATTSGFCKKEGSAVITAAPEKKTKPSKTVEPALEPEQTTHDGEDVKISMTDIRAAAKALVDTNKSEDLQKIFAMFGVKKVSALAEADYPVVHAALVNANG